MGAIIDKDQVVIDQINEISDQGEDQEELTDLFADVPEIVKEAPLRDPNATIEINGSSRPKEYLIRPGHMIVDIDLRHEQGTSVSGKSINIAALGGKNFAAIDHPVVRNKGYFLKLAVGRSNNVGR
jgi:hypothetical protein